MMWLLLFGLTGEELDTICHQIIAVVFMLKLWIP
jgi:hypothetical protein